MCFARDSFDPCPPRTSLETRFPNVDAVGDIATVGIPKAGVFSERAARVVADMIVARRVGGEAP